MDRKGLDAATAAIALVILIGGLGCRSPGDTMPAPAPPMPARALSPPDSDGDYAEVYDKWRASIQAELDAGFSFLIGDTERARYLRERAPMHFGFLRSKLTHDVFTVVMLSAGDLNQEVERKYGYSPDLQGRQRSWLKFLDEKLGQATETNGREAERE